MTINISFLERAAYIILNLYSLKVLFLHVCFHFHLFNNQCEVFVCGSHVYQIISVMPQFACHGMSYNLE